MPIRVFSTLELQYLHQDALRLALELLGCESEPDNPVERALGYGVLFASATGNMLTEQALRELVEMFMEFPSIVPAWETDDASVQELPGSFWIV